MNGASVGKQSLARASAKCSLPACTRRSSKVNFSEQTGQGCTTDLEMFLEMDGVDFVAVVVVVNEGKVKVHAVVDWFKGCEGTDLDIILVCSGAEISVFISSRACW